MADPSPRQFTREELETRNHREDALLVIDNVVYDVTGFLQDHPGGPEVLIDNAGRDASQCFHDVGHSDDARSWMQQYVAGEVVPEQRLPVRARPPQLSAAAEPLTLTGLLSAVAPPLMLAAIAWWLHSYLFS